MRWLSNLLLLLFVCVPAFSATEGLLVTADGTPIEHAEVLHEQSGQRALSNGRGVFRIDADPPLSLRIRHPRFVERTVEVQSSGARIELDLKQEYFEEIAVSARGDARVERFAPVSVATTVIEPSESIAPATVREVVAQTPGVSENGQGGLFQNYSVRGTSRQRVLTLVSGMRVISERRAGASASFIDPGLLETLDVIRGPASTYYGSGALGGVLQLIPRRFDGWAANLGYDTNGDESQTVVGYGDAMWSAGVAFRRANNGRAPTGLELNSEFSQLSAVGQLEWGNQDHSYAVEVVASRGSDIGKANTDFPTRTTVYPEEGHVLARFSYARKEGWQFDAYAHPNDLVTRVTESGETSDVRNRAVDLGFNLRREIDVPWAGSARAGVDYFGRRSVNAREISPTLDQRTLRNGEEDELGFYGATEWAWGRASLLAGARLAAQRQDNESADSRDETAVTGFFGAVVPVGTGVELVGNIGSGLRFPTLSESFFSGTTGRGQVIGNPNLEPERSVNVDAGVRWFASRHFFSGYVFRNEIDDYIERIFVAPDVRTFVNLQSGVIEGIEFEGVFKLAPRWQLSAGGHAIEGRDDADSPLADIPADSAHVGATYKHGNVRAELRWEQRSSKDDPGSGEMTIPSASLVSAALDYRVNDQLGVSFYARNLLDEEYFSSADDSVPLAPERAFGVNLRWTGKPR